MTKGPSPSQPSEESSATGRHAGISNRESAGQESAERAAHPPVNASATSEEGAAGRVDERPTDVELDLQTSHKAGSRSMAQKESASRYADKAMPASNKVPGASGRESNDSTTKNPH